MKNKQILYLITGFCVLFITTGLVLRGAHRPAADKTLLLGAYTATREAYNAIIPAFQKHWFEKTGQRVEVQPSYLGSAAQARAIVGGFDADIAALSLASDMTLLANEKLLTSPWQDQPYGGMVTHSLVVLSKRPNSALDVQDWDDLITPGLDIMTANPKTSGGAQWNFLAIYGAAERGRVPGFGNGASFARAVFRNVLALDKGARESIINFERGMGDVAITYENEVHAAHEAGQQHELIYPTSTVLIENPAALIDAHVDLHDVRAEAEAFMAFLWSEEAQNIFAKHGFRPVDTTILQAWQDKYPAVPDLWTVQEFGGWETVAPAFFGHDGLYENILHSAQQDPRA